jgi:hypothetical protein
VGEVPALVAAAVKITSEPAQIVVAVVLIDAVGETMGLTKTVVVP